MERHMRRYVGPDLPIVDEIGYLPCDRQSADLLYSIITRRHGRRSTIVTTNLAFKQWSTVFPGAACVGALVDASAT
jgi:DNA replication protein DnaC